MYYSIKMELDLFIRNWLDSRLSPAAFFNKNSESRLSCRIDLNTQEQAEPLCFISYF